MHGGFIHSRQLPSAQTADGRQIGNEINASGVNLHWELKEEKGHKRRVTSIFRGSTVVKVLRYKLEGRWFDPSWCQWTFH